MQADDALKGFFTEVRINIPKRLYKALT